MACTEAGGPQALSRSLHEWIRAITAATFSYRLKYSQVAYEPDKMVISADDKTSSTAMNTLQLFEGICFDFRDGTPTHRMEPACADFEAESEIELNTGKAGTLGGLTPTPSSSTSPTMLTSRGVQRLSRRALNSAKRTNAFFSTAAAAPILGRAANLPSGSHVHARPARASSQAGTHHSLLAV